MTVPNELAYVELQWTGAETLFAPSLVALHVDHVRVRYRPLGLDPSNSLMRGLHYEATLNEATSVWSATPLAMPVPPGVVEFARYTPAVQATDFETLGKYSPGVHELLHDASALRDAELRRDIGFDPPSSEIDGVVHDLTHMPPKTFAGNIRTIAGPVQMLTPAQVKSNLVIVVADVLGLTGQLDAKANTIHTHAIADVIGLQAQLDAIIAGQALPTFRRATYPELAAEITQADGTVGMVYADPTIATTQRSRAANIATLTTLTPHAFSTNQRVNVRNMQAGYAALGAVVTVTGPNTFTYPNSGADEGATADTTGRLDRSGIYLFDDPTDLWTWQADAPWQQLEQRIQDQEAITQDFRQPAAGGELFYASGQGGGRGEWDGRHELRNRVTNEQDWTDPSLYQVLITPVAAGHVGVAVVGDDLHITNDTATNHSFAGPLSLLGRVQPYRSFSVKAALLSFVDATGAFAVGLAFSPTGPVGGGGVANLDAATEVLTWRMNGARTIYKRDALTVGTTIIWTGLGGGTPAWGTGVEVEIALACDDLGTSASVAFIMEGSVFLRGSLTGLVPGMYVGPVFRSIGATSAKIIDYKINDPNDGVPRRWYVDPSVGSTGNGTTRAPWIDYRDAVAEDNSDPQQGYYEIIQKQGICLSAPNFAGKKVRSVVLRSVGGQGAFIHNARYFPAFGASFTQPDPGPYPNVWRLVLPPDVSAGATLVDASMTQPNGRTGSETTEFAHHSRAGFNTAIATINAKPGWHSYHTVGAYVGSILFHPIHSGDPNTHNYWLSRGYGVGIEFENQDDWNAATLRVDGMGFGFCYGAAIWVARGYLEASNFDIYGVTGNGIQCSESDYRLHGGKIRGTLFDNFNNQGGLVVGTDPSRLLHGQIFGTQMLGCPVGLLDGAIFGDCFSNHRLHTVYMDGAVLRAAAKDGVAALAPTTIKDTIIEDCVLRGVVLQSDGDGPLTGRVIGGRIDGCVIGVEASTVDGAVTIYIDGGTHFRNNVASSLSCQEIGPDLARIRVYDWATSGATPLDGHLDPNAGVIEALTPRQIGGTF